MKKVQKSGRWMPMVSGALLLGAGAAIGTYFFTMQRRVRLGVRSATASEAPPPSAQPTSPSALAPAVEAAARKTLERKITLVFGSADTRREVSATLAEAGVIVDDAAVQRVSHALERAKAVVSDDYYLSGAGATGPVPVRVDRVAALGYLAKLKDQLDRAPHDARIDMEKRAVLADQPGLAIRPYESMTALEEAARSGEARVELAATELAPHTTKDSLKNVDISTVMGSYETPFSVSARDSDRTYNLKVAAEKVSGFILMPGEEFSFNEVVGDRTEKEGYRVAPVIQAGELVDGLAGGACQISSTLHAAAFFAGLDITQTRPHSRPSGYIVMGLDSTVVYPTVDLKLKNNFDFPVVFYYQVNQGRVRVEILGKERPYKVTFSRNITRRDPFEIVEREDPALPLGYKHLMQKGVEGFGISKRRTIYDAKTGKEVTTNKWTIAYPPTTEYWKVGTNPDPLAKTPPPEPPHPPKDTGRSDSMSISQGPDR
ncbi:MAG: VanW family protein [Deltaproteobacteria bacterium]|nr:VanW family protein [Deltaproteobacteria bacterium]